MTQEMPPKGSAVYLLETLKSKDYCKIPVGTVGVVQEHCSDGKLKVQFKLSNKTVEVEVGVKKVKRKIFTVLSIDGGGIRGIIPARILEYIEKQMGNCMSDGNEKCQPHIADVFDLIAGTSTGGIIALALTKPDDNGRPKYTAKELVDLYLEKGKTIFNRPINHRIRSVNGLLNKKYPADGIKEVLETYFEETKLNEAVTPVLIPTYDMRGARVHWQKRFDCRRGGHPRFFKSYRINESEQKSDNCQQQSTDCSSVDPKPLQQSEDNYFMRDVARATSAAPTYFEPVALKFHPAPKLKLIETLVDGGIFANNPAMCAYADMRKMIRSKGGPNAQILLVSLGTGNLTGTLDAESAKNWGGPRWVPTLITMIFDGASDTVDYQLQQLIPEKKRYYRFQPQLTFGNHELDDVNQANLLELKALTEAYIKKEECRLNTVSQQLVDNWFHEA